MIDDQNAGLVRFHIARAVAAAKRKHLTITFSLFVKRLRRRNPTINIHDSFILSELVKNASAEGVAVEVDRAPE